MDGFVSLGKEVETEHPVLKPGNKLSTRNLLASFKITPTYDLEQTCF